MTGPQILLWPDARLRQHCEPVAEGEDMTALATAMLAAMYAAQGRGLAAPQVGVLQRLFVMDAGWKTGAMTPLICVNPEILALSDQRIAGAEGCLSIPGDPLEVLRPDWIELRWQGLDGSVQQRRLTGFEARCAQHEIDHLNGKVIFDHLDEDKRALLEGAYLEARR